jgi:hypothetical protein
MTCGVLVGSNSRQLSIGRVNAYHQDIEKIINRQCMGGEAYED